MTRWLRFALVALRALWRPRLAVTDGALLAVRVWPTEADVTAANYASYLIYLEAARLDLLLRSGVAWRAREEGWGPTVGALYVRYRRPLRRLQRAEISTRILSWDEQWLYMEQRVQSGTTEHAWAMVRVALRGREGRVDPRVVAESLGLSPPGLTDVERVRAFLTAESAMERAGGASERTGAPK